MTSEEFFIVISFVTVFPINNVSKFNFLVFNYKKGYFPIPEIFITLAYSY